MELKDLAQRLVQFESTHENSKALNACLDFCVEYFSSAQVHVEHFEFSGIRSVVIANTSDKNLDVLLLGHIDTVPGKPALFEGRIERGRLYGRGSLDMKAFVATSMKVLESVLANGDSPKVGLAIVTDEELGGVYGAKELAKLYKPKLALVPDDGEDIATIISATKHIYQVKFTAQGREAHANRPWDGVNAIELLTETFQKLKKHFNVPTTEPVDRFIDTCSLGIISGGVAGNEVPETAEMIVDVRIASGLTRKEVELVLDAVTLPGVTFEIMLEGAPAQLNVNDPIVKKYARALKAVTGETAKFIKTGGATDARYFSERGVLTIVHQGNGKFAQAENEHVELESLQDLVDIQNKFIASF